MILHLKSLIEPVLTRPSVLTLPLSVRHRSSRPLLIYRQRPQLLRAHPKVLRLLTKYDCLVIGWRGVGFMILDPFVLGEGGFGKVAGGRYLVLLAHVWWFDVLDLIWRLVTSSIDNRPSLRIENRSIMLILITFESYWMVLSNAPQIFLIVVCLCAALK